mgnify:CR=1 FL=1
MGLKLFVKKLLHIQDEGVVQGTVDTIDFTGTGISATVAGNKATITVSGGGGGAPTTADYLVGTANGDLSAEIVVGTTPGGELGGTWASPTVDATHSGSAHHNAVTIGADAEHSLATQVLSGVDAAAAQKGHLQLAGDLAGSASAPTVVAASQTVAGKVELATAAEINTGTDTTRAIPVDQFVASNRNVRYVLWRVLDPATAHTVSTTVGGDLELPFTGTITEIGAYVDTAGTTNLATIDVHLNGTTLMTTNKITIDSTEKTSRTAATAPGLTTTAVTAGDLLTVDIDAIQTTAAKGLTIRIGIRQT